MAKYEYRLPVKSLRISRMINHPMHYKSNNFEVINIIDDFALNFCLGNVIKYILRAGKKSTSNRVEDLQKAQWYLNHEIEKCIKREKVG